MSLNRLLSDAAVKVAKIMDQNSYSMDAMLDSISLAASTVASNMDLGRVESRIFCPKTEIDPAGLNETKIFYQNPVGYEMEHVEYSCTLPGNGQVIFKAYPIKGEHFTEIQHDDIMWLLGYFGTNISRARMIGILDRAPLTDPLTHIPNLAGVVMFARHLIETGEIADYVLAFSNIVGFNYINQQLTSEIGDLILCRYANILRASMPEGEIVGRPGGDNFIAIIHRSRVEEYLEYIREVKLPIHTGDIDTVVLVKNNTGVYGFKEGDTMNEALTGVSVALGVAKSTPNSDVIWLTQVMLDRVAKERKIIANFRKALENREYMVYYQPKINIETMSVEGGEALARWNCGHEIMAPDDFISVLEKRGDICELDFYVLNCVCEDIKGWLEAGLDPKKISVNFSRHHLKNRNFAEDVVSVIRSNGIDPKYIEIELTEKSWCEDIGSMSEIIGKLRSYGLTTAIDDFGMGYSSLGTLKDLDVDTIKIDRTFVDKMVHNSKNMAIVDSMIGLAKKLNLEIICEGVETTEQAEEIRKLGCNMIQGFLFDRPLEKSEFTRRLEGKHDYQM